MNEELERLQVEQWAEEHELSLGDAKELQQLLTHPGLKRVWKAMEARIVRHWKAASDPLAREMVHHDWKAFERFQVELRITGERPPLHIEED